ncbi:class I SAM-dependent methyltransferase [Allohahella marinimesophila]|uniref:Methyltransferase domain-containing protein n=1 Tax=Allohahella marinimesophila TaxID=1054972 RepID=A0ABP7Q6F3_9GAMM
MPDPYNQKAQQYSEQYQQLSFVSAHAAWTHLLPSSTKDSRAIDIGAGSGRDAAGLAALGWHVLAIEPSDGLRRLGETATANLNVDWLSDKLPHLPVLHELHGGNSASLILVSAVWMHLTPDEQTTALPVLTQLIEPSGLLVITLRHGPSPDERVFYETNSAALQAHGERLGLETVLLTSDDDKLQRNAVSWETIVFRKKG